RRVLMTRSTRASRSFLFSIQLGSNRNTLTIKFLALWLAVLMFLVPFLALPVQAQPPCSFDVIATLDVGDSPFGVTTSPDGTTVWIANSGGLFANSNKVTVLNASSFAIETVITVGNFPEDTAFTDDGSQAFVTNSSDSTVSVINTATRTV